MSPRCFALTSGRMKLPLNWGGEEALREDQELSLGQELKCLTDIQVEVSEEAAKSGV